MREAQVRRVAVDAILGLRHAVLRPGRPPESARFEGDDAADTRHYALSEEGRCVACLSLMRSVHRGRPAWQLRGMAVEGGRQGKGLGSLLLRGMETELEAEGEAPGGTVGGAMDEAASDACGGVLLWCNAREAARPFYERNGWRVCSERFAIEGIGPHWRMERVLRVAS